LDPPHPAKAGLILGVVVVVNVIDGITFINQNSVSGIKGLTA